MPPAGATRAPAAARACPDSALRDVYFGLLGPGREEHHPPSARGGATVQSATVAPYGAYLVVLPHSSRRHCEGRVFVCMGDSGSTSSPTLVANGAITGAAYRNAPSCTPSLPAEAVRVVNGLGTVPKGKPPARPWDTSRSNRRRGQAHGRRARKSGDGPISSRPGATANAGRA